MELLIALIVIAVILIREACEKPVAPGTDLNIAQADFYQNNLSRREYIKRLENGYYVRK